MSHLSYVFLKCYLFSTICLIFSANLSNARVYLFRRCLYRLLVFVYLFVTFFLQTFHQLLPICTCFCKLETGTHLRFRFVICTRTCIILLKISKLSVTFSCKLFICMYLSVVAICLNKLLISVYLLETLSSNLSLVQFLVSKLTLT